MKCSACGGENSEGARFCKHCGATLSASAPVAADSVDCPECGAANKAGAAFCVACGHGLAKRTASPTAAVTSEPKALQIPAAAPSVSEEHEAPAITPAQAQSHTLQDPPLANADEAPPKAPSKMVLWLAGVIGIVAISLTGYILFGRYAKAPAPSSVAPVTAPEQKNEAKLPAAMPDATKPSDSPSAQAPLSSSKAAETKPVSPSENAKKSPTVPKPAGADKQPSTPVVKKAQPPATSTQDGQPVTAESAKPNPAPSTTSSDKSNFERELDACRTKGFLGRGICTEQVKWKYCSVNGVWDASKPGCER